MELTNTTTTIIILFCIVIIITIYFNNRNNRNNRNNETEDTFSDELSDNSIKNQKMKERIDIHNSEDLVDPIYLNPSYVPIISTNTQSIKQFRIDLSDIINMSTTDYVNLPYKYGFEYPIRIRSSRDIVHPDSSGSIAPDEEINDMFQFMNIIKKIQKIGKNNKMWEKIVIQEVPRGGTEYILSCLNGIVDKFYVINRGSVEGLSIKKISDSNMKYLRKILFAQHKKLGTINGIFELGFFVDNLKQPLTKNPTFKYVGISITFVTSRDESVTDLSKLISYPYNETKKDTNDSKKPQKSM
jgi:hypothetical protein